MRRLLTIALVAAVTLPSLGCLVTTRDRHRHGSSSSASSRRSCPPSTHWNGNDCVHNGKAKGHHKHGKHK